VQSCESLSRKGSQDATFYDAKSFANETFVARSAATSTITNIPELMAIEARRREDVKHAESTMFAAMAALVGSHTHRPPSPVLVLTDITLADTTFQECMSPSMIDHEGSLRGYKATPHFEESVRSLSPISPTQSVLHHIHGKFDMSVAPKCNTSNNWDILTIPGCTEALSRGEAFMNFSCKPAGSLTDREREMANMVIRINTAESLEKDGCPDIDLYNPADCSKYTLILTRGTYVLPNVDVTKMTPAFIASMDYQKGCLPGSPYLWPKTGTSDEEIRTFRMTKPLIPFVFSIVIQMRTTHITDPDVVRRLEDIDKLKIAHCIIFERTKRSASAKDDSTAKVRSVLMYYPLPDNSGVLVTNYTVVCNTTIPKIVASVVQSFGSRGAAEVAETAHRTRKFLLTQPTVLAH
jgi:hypothetical protein